MKGTTLICPVIVLLLAALSCRPKEKNRTEETRMGNEQFAAGRGLFEQHCFSCHRMASKDESMFRDIFSRLPDPSESYFKRFIYDSKALKASGDAYARNLDRNFTSDYEHQFAELTEGEMQQLIDFIKSDPQ